MYASDGDTTVTPANARDCATDIQAHDGNVQLVQLGQADHNNSDILALPRVLRWFTSLRG